MDDQGDGERRNDRPADDEPAEHASAPPRRRSRRGGDPGRFWAGLNRHRSPESATDRSSDRTTDRTSA